MSVSGIRKRVSVSFAGDDDVLQHIVSIQERKASLRSEKSVKHSNVEHVKVDETPEENAPGEDAMFRPSAALAVDAEMEGGEVFGWKTPKKSNQMRSKASEAAKLATPKTPRTPASDKTRTPKSILKSTPHSRLSVGGVTPRASKRLLKKCYVSTPLKDSDGDDTSEESEIYESDEEENNVNTPIKSQTPSKRVSVSTPTSRTPRRKVQQSKKLPGEDDSEDVTVLTPLKLQTPNKATQSVETPTSRTPRGRGRTKKKLQEEDETVKAAAVEDYFAEQSQGTGVTSDHTLARLKTPRMDQESLTEALQGVEAGYQQHRDTLYKQHTALFNTWMYQLCNGYNLILHGLGSKRRLMEEFRQTILKDFNHLVINGYFPSLTIKSILNAITEDVLDHEGSFRNPVDQCDYIRQHYECAEHEDFYLIVHNIDGTMLRGERAQMLLSQLAKIRGFHLIASIDHINAPLIWDQNKVSHFSWLWYDVTTFDPYIEETSYENSLLVQQTGSLALSSLTHVMKSLTPNTKGIFLLLARHQLDCKNDSTYQGLAFPDLYQKCREAFLVNSDLTLRTQLTEFKDHKLIRMKKGIDGMEYLLIPLDAATLVEFLEQQEQQS